ncbi:MAG: xanthine dehydrogenase accessory protein XdhC [Gammaproteobacteria bacterium]|nr:xanthine dehydrogenase accessory protein XdhC [Gammaproteobacteria bacterium]
MNDWLAALSSHLLSDTPMVRVVVASVHGSSPRAVGTTMLVGATQFEGSIGGGHLEWQALAIARTLLTHPQQPAVRLERFALGEKLGQCCGGSVEVWFERYDSSAADFVVNTLARRKPDSLLLTVFGLTLERLLVDADCLPDGLILPADFAVQDRALLITRNDSVVLIEPIASTQQQLWLFGAGHVGKALVKLLADLPLRITWIDSRPQMFPATLSSNVTPLCTDDPVAAARGSPPDTWFLVMTHSHDLDYDLCCALLTRADFAWLGLIGSRTKAARFTQRLKRQGITAQRLARLTCPIGLATISSKLPAAIALSTTAQLLGLIEQRRAGSLTSHALQHGAKSA